MINTFNVGRTGSPDASTLTGHVAKTRNAGSAAEAAASDFSKFLSDVLTKIDNTSTPQVGPGAAAPPAPVDRQHMRGTSVAPK